MNRKITNDNKKIVGRLYKEVLFDWNMAVADDLIADNFISHDWPENSPTGPKAFQDFYSEVMRFILPDARYEVDDLIAEDDRVVVRWRLSGTHQGRYQNIAPSGKFITLKGIAFYRLENSKVAERWVYTDVYDVLREIQSGSSS